jgi:RNA polymerase sigma-70 factor (ECF subfamily)
MDPDSLEHCRCTAASTWDEVARRHTAGIYRQAHRLTGNRADAEDLTQEVFIRVFRHLEHYEDGTFEGWLYRITKNLFLDQVRRRRATRLEPLTDLHLWFPHAGPEHELERRSLDPDIRDALTSLPPAHCATVVLHDIDGLTYEEIGVLLGVPQGTVASRLHRARRQLRTALAARSPGERRAG